MFIITDSPVFTISRKQFHDFYGIDRKLYNHLVSDLWRDPPESMLIMAFWICLERMGFRDVVTKILSLPLVLINELADEAALCLKCINNDQFLFPSDPYDIPLTQSVSENYVCLAFLHENRESVNRRMDKVLNEVCSKALSDLMQEAIKKNHAISIAESQMPILSTPPCPQHFVQPGPSHLGYVGSGVPQRYSQESMMVPADDRTMFVTFSKGYRVLEWEVREFFTMAYGNCIESLYMQEVHPHEQALFARIVFYSPDTMEMILLGRDKAKFTINGKHVWVRKFVPKHPRSSPSPAPLFLQNLPNTI